MKRILLVLFLACALFSCKSKKQAVAKKPTKRTERVVTKPQSEPVTKDLESEVSAPAPTFTSSVDAYIYQYHQIAQEEMALYKIPASITLAQGILESGSGKGRLSVEANNHFGIKCHGWKGAKIYHDDDADQECFRKYKDPKYSFRDHSLFLSERSRYSGLFKLKQEDYKGWAKGLRAAGYATDRKYPDKLISLIERYKLYEYDESVLGKNYVKYEAPMASVKGTYTVEKGDTLYGISKRYNLTVEQLQKLNGLRGTSLDIGQVLVVKP
ncbi:glucosaminidase domain-containing protein [Tamlana sp. 2_MG-2023]|uniref:glucosaminidase domain-containing protein n=1 Tax=unclassified Tamlana TaxID=2614803 RepID=UPI0026E3782F|nr:MULTISPECIES: glucosaminidase domain-containing protein [unclassified Tamlana]MDO6761366.1 glucosaminidase domain-containing protein [Tamlana sp. 2_MG-2023]MDO6792020.1 glucosaminidase domain-containing protein [Tamlana sp. 1_MG-2023]